MWARDTQTAFCAQECVSDDDCVILEERCRVIDHAELPTDAPLLAEELSAYVEMLPVEEAAITPYEGALRLCDPFWDFVGSTSFDSVEVDPTDDAPTYVLAEDPPSTSDGGSNDDVFEPVTSADE